MSAQKKKAKPKGKGKPASRKKKQDSDDDYNDSGPDEMLDDESKQLRATMKMYSINRQILQFLAAVGVVPENDLKDLYKRLQEAGYDSQGQSLDDAINAINDNLRFMRMEVKRIRAEHDGKFYIVFANNQSDDLAKTATRLSEVEILYFKLLLDHMLKHDGQISVRKAQELASEVQHSKKLNREQMQQCLRSLVEQSWLLPDKTEQRYAIGVRVYGELRSYLTARAAEQWTVNCSLCHEACFLGVKCADEQSQGPCPCKIHFHCRDTLFEQMEPACPDCKRSWRQEPGGREEKKAE